jgi:hypothetical protein
VVVLDDFWTNYGILHGDFRSMRGRDVEALARVHFSETFGLDGEALLIRATIQPGGRSVFASAIPRHLHDGIRDACAEAGLKVRGLTVALPCLLNRIRRELGDLQGVLVVVQEHLLQIVTMDSRQWLVYDAQRLFGGSAADVSGIADDAARLLERSSVWVPGECTVRLVGGEADVSGFGRRFASVQSLPGMAHEASRAMHLIELAP